MRRRPARLLSCGGALILGAFALMRGAAAGDSAAPALEGSRAFVPAGVVSKGCSRHYLTHDAKTGVACLGAFVAAFEIDRAMASPAGLAACREADLCKGSPPIPTVATRVEPSPVPRTHSWAVFVSSTEAEAYCGWRAGRLPTEAEWERARETAAIAPVTGPDGGEWLSGWYTYLPDLHYTPGAARYSSRLVVTMVAGDSYVYGGEPDHGHPGIGLRCVYRGNARDGSAPSP